MNQNGLSMTATNELECWYEEMERKHNFWQRRTARAQRIKLWGQCIGWAMIIVGSAFVVGNWVLGWFGGK